MASRFLRSLLQWCSALLIGFLIVNSLCFFYQRYAGYITTPNGPTDGVWAPGSLWVHNAEGHGVSRADHNGYMNPELPLADPYVLVAGTSYTQASEIGPRDRYTTLVNDHLSQGDGKLHVYNIGISGHRLPIIIRHFSATSQAYGDAAAIIIETVGTNYPAEQLEKALEQVTYDPADTAANHMANRSAAQKLKDGIRNAFPLLNQVLQQLKTAAKLQDRAAAPEREPVDPVQYREVISRVLSTMRSQYEGHLCFLYHPEYRIEPDRTMTILEDPTWEIFREECEKVGIDCIDTGDAYVEYYNARHQVPSGFMNTAPMTGHGNKIAHRIYADLILEYLEDKL